MKKRMREVPGFDADGYQIQAKDLNGEKLPDWKALEKKPRLTLGQAKIKAAGGARPGAGRKPLGKVRKQVKLTPAAVKRFQSFARRRGLDFSSAIDAASLMLK